MNKIEDFPKCLKTDTKIVLNFNPTESFKCVQLLQQPGRTS